MFKYNRYLINICDDGGGTTYLSITVLDNPIKPCYTTVYTDTLSDAIQCNLGVSDYIGGIFRGIGWLAGGTIPPNLELDTPKIYVSIPMALSDAKVRNLKPKEKPYKTADYDGLYVLTKPNGSKLWRFKYRLKGKEKLLSIGSYPEISLMEARAKRDEARKQIVKEKDPSETKQEKKLQGLISDGNTFAKIAEQYVAKLIKEGRAESTIKKIDWLLDMANSDLGSKPITEITAPMILQTLKKIEAKGIY